MDQPAAVRVLSLKKKQHHYVFRAHLKAWATNDQVWCLRDSKVFLAQIGKVACERFFYQVQDLSQDEISLIEKAFVEMCPEPLQKAHRQFMSLYSLPSQLRKMEGLGAGIANRIDELITNLGED